MEKYPEKFNGKYVGYIAKSAAQLFLSLSKDAQQEACLGKKEWAGDEASFLSDCLNYHAVINEIARRLRSGREIPLWWIARLHKASVMVEKNFVSHRTSREWIDCFRDLLRLLDQVSQTTGATQAVLKAA